MTRTIEERIEDKFRDIFELFDKAKITGKYLTVIVEGNKYYISCNIRPIIKSSNPSDNSSSKKDCQHIHMSLIDGVPYCDDCNDRIKI